MPGSNCTCSAQNLQMICCRVQVRWDHALRVKVTKNMKRVVNTHSPGMAQVTVKKPLEPTYAHPLL